jgi:hypothetical protein
MAQGTWGDRIIGAHRTGHLTAAGESHVPTLEGVLDEFPEGHDAAWPTRKERVHTD